MVFLGCRGDMVCSAKLPLSVILIVWPTLSVWPFQGQTTSYILLQVSHDCKPAPLPFFVAFIAPVPMPVQIFTATGRACGLWSIWHSPPYHILTPHTSHILWCLPFFFSSVCLSVWILSRPYLLNCSTFCNQTWYDDVLLSSGVPCRKIVLLSSRSRSQQRLISPKYDCFYYLFYTYIWLQPSLVWWCIMWLS